MSDRSAWPPLPPEEPDLDLTQEQHAATHRATQIGCLAMIALAAPVVVLASIVHNALVPPPPHKSYRVSADTRETFKGQVVRLTVIQKPSCGSSRPVQAQSSDQHGRGILEINQVKPLKVIVEPCFALGHRFSVAGIAADAAVRLADGRVLYLREIR